MSTSHPATNPNIVALHIASGPLGSFVIDAKIPGWVEPEDCVPQTDLDRACYAREDDFHRAWYRREALLHVPKEQLPTNGAAVALLEVDESTEAPLFKLIEVRPTATCGSWDSHAMRDYLEYCPTKVGS